MSFNAKNEVFELDYTNVNLLNEFIEKSNWHIYFFEGMGYVCLSL